MADFPALEVLTRGPLHPGTRIPLVSPFRIGRGRANTLVVSAFGISSKHCELVHEYGRWWIRDLGTTNGTLHLGQRIHEAELRHGDVFELARVCFRLLLQEPVEVRDEQIEQAIIDQPDDPHRWAVYADWLQQHGAPLGERLANPRSADDRSWLGSLAGPAVRGVLQVRWAHGVPERAVLRTLGPSVWRESWEEALRRILVEPVFRFLRTLEIDLDSFDESLQVATAEDVLKVLGPSLLPMLESLVIGPVMPPDDPGQLAPQLSARRALHACFSTTTASLHRLWRVATLTFDGRSYALDRSNTFHGGAQLGLPAVFEIFCVGDRWRLRAGAEVKINGIALRGTALLRPGDLIEPLPGVHVHFDA